MIKKPLPRPPRPPFRPKPLPWRPKPLPRPRPIKRTASVAFTHGPKEKEQPTRQCPGKILRADRSLIDMGILRQAGPARKPATPSRPRTVPVRRHRRGGTVVSPHRRRPPRR